MSDIDNSVNQEQELESFVELFTEGIEPDVDQIDDTPPATPDNQEDTGDQGSESGTDETPNTENKDTQNQQNQENPPESNVPDKDGDKNADQNVEEVFTKSDKAFAELRVANKTQGDLLLRMTRLANIDAKNPMEAIQKLSEHLDRIEANHGNLTYSEVERIRQMDKEQAEQKAQLQEKARVGFDVLKNTHKLMGNEIMAFAEELRAKGINPFETPVDLVAQYRSMHYDQLINAAREEGKEIGRQEELARRAKAQTQSTTPLTRNGGTNTGESLDSTDKLRAFLDK